MRKLTKKELGFLQTLYNDKELAFRGCIRQFLLRHTYEPKYKVGDYVKITDDTYSYIWGCRIKNVNAKITEIAWWLSDKGDEKIQYRCIAYDQFGKEHFLCAEESLHGYYEQRHIVGKSDNDQNTFEKKSQFSDSSSISF